MKHHIAIKFIAVFLAALALLTAVGSGAGIVCMTALDLYDRSVSELQEEQMSGQRREFAVNLAHRYASLELGGLPDQFLDMYFGSYWLYDTFEYGRYYYTIKDETGAIVESTADQPLPEATRYVIQVTDIRYRRVVHELPQGGEYVPSETIPEETLPEATTPGETAAEISDPTAEDSSADQILVEEQSIALASAEDETIYSDWYYDYKQDKQVEVRWQYEKLPPYTVELYLLPGAVPDAYKWTLLEMVWNVRRDLFWILAAGLLAFAISIVYLCCAAGHKPGRKEVYAGGLNRVPLDLYLSGVVGLIALAIALCATFGGYLLSESPTILLPLLVLAGYVCALLIVGFLFALAAQFKTPGGYWWRGSVTGRCVKLLWTLAKKCMKLCRWLLTHLPEAVKKLLGGIFGILGKTIKWVGSKLAWLYSLLPLTWQWILSGAGLAIVLLISLTSPSAGGLILGLAVACAIILYGAYGFGILLEGAKHMSKGDLDNKVDDKLLVGAFKAFAGDLNALSQVAVTAAQNQMKAERMKTELITNVSHDIKTPLTSIINFVDLMEKPHSPQEQAEYLEVLSRQSQRLKKLIDDLMEMSKASTGNLTVEITRLDAAEAINQALGEFADKLERAELTPIFHPPEKNIPIRADGRLTWRVMSNLLGNAVKYAMPGTRLYIDLAEVDGKAVISMKNISRDSLNVSAEELLERFVRGDTARNTEGSGLGLNIAQSLMEVQKGQLRLLVDGDLFKVTLLFPVDR